MSSFDAGYGSTHMARIVGQKKAREIWFLCKYYSAQEALDMGLVNTVVPLDELEKVPAAQLLNRRFWSLMGFCFHYYSGRLYPLLLIDKSHN